ncbi:MAG: hypothetical protein IJI98_06130 [Methanosphaera sp.]|nr:hypothetical protein [Methanosphaera sp.]
MMNKNIKRMFLLLTLIFLLVGVVSAAETVSDDTVKDTTLTSAKPVDTINEVKYEKNINKQNNKDTKTGSANTTDTKASTYTTTAANYKQLSDKINQAKKSNYTTYTINLKKGNYNATKTLIWANTEKTTKLVINANNSIINGQGKYQFIQVDEDYTLELNKITLTKFVSENGGAIENNGTLTIKNSKLTYNKADEDGGAIYSYGDLTVTNSQFTGNSAEEDGGAIYIYRSYDAKITKNNFTSNKADDDGGAICIYGSYDTNITYNQFIKNKAEEGGAIANIPRSESYTYMGQESYIEGEQYLEQYWNPTKNYGITGYTTTYNYNPMGFSTPIQIPQYGYTGGYDYRTATRYVTKYRTVPKTGYNYYGSDTTIQSNKFIENEATDEAAAIKIDHGDVLIIKNKFHRNKDNLTKEAIKNDGKQYTKNVYKYSSYGNPILDEGNTNITQNTFDDRKDTTITLSKLNTAYYGTKLKISGKLLNNKNPVKNQNITISFNNKKYTAKTSKTGYFAINVTTKNIGKYTLKLSYAGNKNYLSTSASKVVTVNKRITKVTITKIPQKKLKDKVTITGKFTTKEGNTLKNTTLSVTFNGKTYKVVTNSKGVYAKKVVANKVGTNTVSVTFKGNSKYKAVTSKTTFKTVKN